MLFFHRAALMRVLYFLSAALFTLCFSSSALVGQNRLSDQQTTVVDATTQTDIGFRSGSFVVAPIPFSNPTIGNGLTLGTVYLFQLPGSKPSAVGLGGFRSANGSEAYAAGGRVNFDSGQWTLGLFGGTADVFYDLPLGGRAIPLKQSGEAAEFLFEYGVTSKVTAGVSFGYLRSAIGLDSKILDSLPDILRPDVDIEMFKLSLYASLDTRNNTFYPTSGAVVFGEMSHAEIEDKAFSGSLSVSNRSYQKGRISAVGFKSVGENGVVAGKFLVCGADEAAPFFDTCGVGFADGLRGFGSLDNLNDWSASAQVEYRGRLSERFGYVAFAGIGGGGDEFDAISLENGGAAAGIGLRYRISKKFGLDYAVDYAINQDDEKFLYLTVGQRF